MPRFERLRTFINPPTPEGKEYRRDVMLLLAFITLGLSPLHPTLTGSYQLGAIAAFVPVALFAEAVRQEVNQLRQVKQPHLP